MRRAGVLVMVAMLVLVSALFLAACGGDEDGAADTSAASTAPIVIRTKMVVAATSGAEPTATGEILERSTLGRSAFCAGGTIRDTHASNDPAMEPYGLIDRTITCPERTVRVGFTPGEVQGLTQAGSWTIVSGTGAFEGIRGSGKMKTAYDPHDDSLARETLTGTVTR